MGRSIIALRRHVVTAGPEVDGEYKIGPDDILRNNTAINGSVPVRSDGNAYVGSLRAARWRCAWRKP